MKLPVTQIVKGHINELVGLNEDISEARMKICRNCPIFSNEFGGICNSKLYIDPETDNVSLKPLDGYVKGCGCRMLAKTTLPNAKCVASKW